jgi:hypothetical protein
MSKRTQITSAEVLRRLSKTKITSTNEVLNQFPSAKMPAIANHLMNLSRLGYVEKIGSNLYRASANRDYYRVTRYLILPVDLFKLAKRYLLQGNTLKETQEITGLPFESIKFVNNAIKGKIIPEIEAKNPVQVKREEVDNLFSSFASTPKSVIEPEEIIEKDVKVQEIPEVPEVPKQDLIEVRYKKEPFHVNHVPVLNYFTISINGVNLKVEEGLHLMYENETVFISR